MVQMIWEDIILEIELINMKTAYINSENSFCVSGGTVYAMVLGTIGSNPVKVQILSHAPEVTTGKNCYPSSKLHGIGSCTRCCTCCISSVDNKGKGVDTRDYLRSSSLRNVCTHPSISTASYNPAIATCFFKQ